MDSFEFTPNRNTGRQPVVSLIGVVDDDESVRNALSSLIRSAGYRCIVFSSAEDFLNSGPQETDCLVLDVRMPGLSGLELQVRLREIDLAVPVIFVTGHADDELQKRAFRQGAVAFFAKPFNDDALLGAIQSSCNPAKDTHTSLPRDARYSG